MFKSAKKLRQYCEEQDLASESAYYLPEKDVKAIQKKAKKESKRYKRPNNRYEQ